MKSAIKPFRGTFYNQKIVKNISKVICPPYDVISKKELSCLRKKSAHNFCHVLIADKKNYKRSARSLQKLINDKILIDDTKDCFYLYQQQFKVGGNVFRRFGYLSLLNMSKKGIFPHEHTLAAPKEDRKRMIASVKANLSPIFVIAAKRLKAFHQIHKLYSHKKPLFKFKDQEANQNCVWRISDTNHTKIISKALDRCKLVIADGHHRFEISYDYFRKNKSKFKDLNYILAYVTDCQKGLNVLPTHRIVSTALRKDAFFDRLSVNFQIKEVSQRSVSLSLKRKGRFSFGICWKGKFYLLTVKNEKILDRIPNKAYKRLDTYVFHHLVLPYIEKTGEMEYTHTVSEAKELAGRRKVAFLLKAVPLELIFEISSKGLRLPQKSTYFYPKVLSGITIRRFKL